jgi:integrase
MALFTLCTGLRRANVTGLAWEHVDQSRKLAWIHPDQAKVRKAIAVPLNETALNGRSAPLCAFRRGSSRRVRRAPGKSWHNPGTSRGFPSGRGNLAENKKLLGGRGRNRTTDTRIFSSHAQRYLGPRHVAEEGPRHWPVVACAGTPAPPVVDLLGAPETRDGAQLIEVEVKERPT